MIHRRLGGMPTTVLACIAIPPENFGFIQLDSRARALNHLAQADDGRAGKGCGNSSDHPAAVEHQRRFIIQYQANCPADVADVDGLIIGIQNQYRGRQFTLHNLWNYSIKGEPKTIP
jgi:hypothetical protein